MYFWLNYSDENHIERITVAVKDIDHLFYLTIEIMILKMIQLIKIK